MQDDYQKLGDIDLELFEPEKEDFWTKSKKQVAFVSSFLLLTPLVYFEATNPAFRADTLNLIKNYPLHSLVVLALVIILLRSIYNKFVFDAKNTSRRSSHNHNYSFALASDEEEEENLTIQQNNSIWTNHKTKIISVSIAAIVVLSYYEFTNPDVAKKTLELIKNNPVLLIGVTLLVVIASIYQAYRQNNIIKNENKLDAHQIPSKNDPEQTKPNKLSLAKEQASLICAVGLLFAGNYAYQHWGTTLNAFSKPWVAGVSIGIAVLLISAITVVAVKEIRDEYCDNRDNSNKTVSSSYDEFGL
jgi:hypothetical protein